MLPKEIAELLQNLNSSKVDISQAKLNKKIIQYLSSKTDYDEKLLKNVIKQLNAGCCAGYTALWGYSHCLTNQPVRKTGDNAPIPRNDIFYFYDLLSALSLWDGESPLDEKLDKEMEYFLGNLLFYQQINEFLRVGHGNFSALEDTRRGNQSFQEEYSIAAMFNKEQLGKLLQNYDVFPENKFIDITHSVLTDNSYTRYHALGLMRRGNRYYLYNSNNPKGEKEFTSIQGLVNYLFNVSADSVPCQFLPFSFRVFDIPSDKTHEYPPQHDVLDKLNSGIERENGWDGLAMAAWVGCEKSAQYFLEKGAKPYLTNLWNTTPITIAARGGHARVLKLLVDSTPTDELINLFWTAIRLGYTEIVKIFVTLTPIKNQINALQRGITPLIAAIKQDHVEIIAILLEAGADSTGNPLMYAAEKGNCQVCALLLDKGISITGYLSGGIGPLEKAAQNGHSQLVNLLINKGYPPSLQAVQLAIFGGHFELADALRRKLKEHEGAHTPVSEKENPKAEITDVTSTAEYKAYTVMKQKQRLNSPTTPPAKPGFPPLPVTKPQPSHNQDDAQLEEIKKIRAEKNRQFKEDKFMSSVRESAPLFFSLLLKIPQTKHSAHCFFGEKKAKSDTEFFHVQIKTLKKELTNKKLSVDEALWRAFTLAHFLSSDPSQTQFNNQFNQAVQQAFATHSSPDYPPETIKKGIFQIVTKNRKISQEQILWIKAMYTHQRQKQWFSRQSAASGEILNATENLTDEQRYQKLSHYFFNGDNQHRRLHKILETVFADSLTTSQPNHP
ncbi:ankyrin repeat domain-containing protein [Legionella taurinensis]|uniref:Uncharacterized protein n=1 Tax=Legionella taurinensis TaxID=70611 RepID=A0A3A5L7G2_9GAMM|nr:ankyrin repeat domain-containing protein [Legionella taurinensis]RJT43314.1 hypothetical protein D6J04_14520 [Legionella taurinensis]RJT65273.1 hypothetical protein D6J03_12860 [Legionella taurinensis]STY26231.1 Ribulose-5-phosphate 4-epimerase and related epimerases and aldolases [Legionella taurinensis]